MEYTIGDIAKKMDISTDTLRYYEKEGLVPFVKRRENGRRYYTDDDLGYFEVIDCMKRAGIPVKEIAVFMEMTIKGDNTLQDRYDFLETNEKKLEEKISKLEENLAFLRWKKWYYNRAIEAGTERVNMQDGSKQVKESVKKEYLNTLEK